MPPTFDELLEKTAAGAALSRDEAESAVDRLVSGQTPPEAIARLLTAWAAKGETAAEIAGAAAALRRHMTPIRHRYPALLDTCGTGGGGSEIFNVSTAAALVIAAAGVPVAKHGNRSVTSRSGSADVLAELGVNVDAAPEIVERCLDELGVCFCFARAMHPAMRHVAEVRRQLGVRTIFNVIGPLANPAGATRQLVGAGRPELRLRLAEALRLLGSERAWVVSGCDGLGEATLAGPTHVSQIGVGGERDFDIAPEEFDLPRSSLEKLRITSPADSAAIVRRVLDGEAGPPRDIVVLNAAAGLMAADETWTAATAARRACEAIDGGAARDLLEKLARRSQG